MMIRNAKQLAKTIDYTLLGATAVKEDITQLCAVAKQFGFYSVCVQPRWVEHAAGLLDGSDVKVVSVAGFPLGANTPKIKAAEVKEAIYAGADEVDVVADLASVISYDERYIRNEVVDVLKVCRAMKPAVVLKLIIEAAALTIAQKQFICEIASSLEVDFVKTSTGYHPAGGATAEDVRLMKEYAPLCKVKASGGIKTAAQAIEMLEAGADRLGSSAAVDIIKQFEAEIAGQQT